MAEDSTLDVSGPTSATAFLRIGRLLKPSLAAFPSVALLALLWKLSLSDGGRDALTLLVAQIVTFLGLAALVLAGHVRVAGVTSAIFGMAGALAVSSIASVRPESSVNDLLLWLFYPSMFLLILWALSSRPLARRFLDGLVAVAGWVALVGFYLFWGSATPGMRWYSTFYWPNPFAAFLLLVIPVEISQLVHARSTRDMLGHAAMLVLLGVPFILTYSRGAWVTLAVVVPLSLILLRPHSRSAMVYRSAIVGACVVGLVILLTKGAALRSSPQAVLGRVVSVANASDNSIQGRLNFWRSGLEIFRDYPLLGTGPGTYAYVHARYQRDVRHYARDAHSIYVQTASEMGVVGLAALAVLLVAIIRLCLRTLRMTRGSEDYPRVAGITFGLIAFSLHSGLDMNWQFPANPAMAFALVAVLAAYDRIFSTGEGPVRGHPARGRVGPWRWATVAILLLASGAAYLKWAGQQKFLEGGRYVRLRQWPAAAASLEAASRLDPLNPRAPSGLAVVLERLGADEAEITRAIRRSIALDPMTPYYRIQLAEVIYRRSPSDAARRREAIELLRHALMLDPYHQPEAYGLLARIYENSGEIAQAEAVFQEARARYGRGWTDDGVLRTMLWPGVARLYMDWARFLIRQGRLPDAGRVYQEIIAEDAGYVPAYLEGADLLLRRHRAEDAVVLLRRGLDHAPASESLWRRWRQLSVDRSRLWEQ